MLGKQTLITLIDYDGAILLTISSNFYRTAVTFPHAFACETLSFPFFRMGVIRRRGFANGARDIAFLFCFLNRFEAY